MPGPKQIARFCGRVQGVVVQIRTVVPSSTAAFSAVAKDPPALFATPTAGDSTTPNFTQTASTCRSWYSTSASASAVFSTGDHITGFDP